MNAGRLNEFILVQKPIIKQNKYGATESEWIDYYTTRTDVQFSSGSRTIVNNEISFVYEKTFTIRFYHDIKESYRIIWKDNKYRILSIEEDRDKQLITIRTQLINE